MQHAHDLNARTQGLSLRFSPLGRRLLLPLLLLLLLLGAVLVLDS
jgi:hypothetical protein